MLYYINEQNLQGVVINLDWEKAFDRVNWELLIKTMKKIGFTVNIIKWIMNLYTNIKSTCLVNGHFTKTFNIQRGIRQGCPLSMIVYVIFQESLYQALEKCSRIIPPEIRGTQIKILGYADDTTSFIRSDEGILEFFKIIKMFELATNSRLNIHKTKFFGHGSWRNRTIWPIKNVKTEVDYFKTLGIIFSNDYNKAVEITWNNIYNKICNRIKLIKMRRYTLYQKGCLVNSILLSKVWYTAHVYPLTMEVTKRINKETFRFIWNSNRDFMKREVLYNPKENGGINLINLFTKAQSIFLSTTLKMLINSETDTLIQYYMKGKVSKYITITNSIQESRTSTVYYEYAINSLKTIHKVPNFPNVTSKEIYRELRSISQPRVENVYPMKKWNEIWKNLNFKYINIKERNIMYRFLHEILPNNKRLYEMKIKNSPNCIYCQVIDTNMHKFFYCNKIKKAAILLKKILEHISNMKLQYMEKLLYLELPNVQRKAKNAMKLVVCSYVSCIWKNRENLEFIEEKFRAGVYSEKKFIMVMLKGKAKDLLCKKYCEIDLDILSNMSIEPG